jgi:hypothetical protein
MDLPGPSDTDRFTELSPASYASPAVSAVFVYGVVPGVLVAAIGLALIRAFRMRRRLSRMLEVPGAILIDGDVEPDAEGTPPVEVTIVQSGVPIKGRRQWVEIRRAVTARPFYLRTPGGSLRVEPDEHTTLTSGLDEISRELARRTIAASLAPGSRAYVVGVQGKGTDPRGGGDYRSSPEAVVVRPASGQGMLISGEAPDRLFGARAWFHFKWALALVVILGLDQLWFTGYFDRNTRGQVVWARVTDTRQWVTSSGGRYGTESHQTHFGITAEASGGRTFVAEIGRDDVWLDWKGVTVPFVVVPGSSDSQFGMRASANGLAIFGGMLTSLIAALVFLGNSQVTRPWFDRRRVNHSGSVPLDRAPPLVSPP